MKELAKTGLPGQARNDEIGRFSFILAHIAQQFSPPATHYERTDMV